MKIAYIFRHDPAYIRSTKEIKSLVQAGHAVTFIGWNFCPDETHPHDLPPEVRVDLLNISSDFGSIKIKDFCLWYRHIIKCLRKYGPFDVLHCVDEYPVLMVLPFKHSLYKYIVLDVYDSIIKRKATNAFITFSYHVARFLANTFSDRIIETSDQLAATLGRFRRKSIVIYNSPEDPYPYIKGIFPDAAAPIRIAATGGLHSGSMALQTLLKAVDHFPKGEIEIIASGWLQDGFALNIFQKHRAVKYRWIEDQIEYYREIARCDLVYNVRVDALNSQYRSLVFPTKIFDAMSVGRPVIVASENKVSEWVLKNGLGFTCSYTDYMGLSDIFKQCLFRRAALESFSEHSRKLFRDHYEWSIVAGRLLNMYKELAQEIS